MYENVGQALRQNFERPGNHSGAPNRDLPASTDREKLQENTETILHFY